MALEAQLNPLNVPFATEFPGTVQGLLQLIAEYMEITGLQDFNGVNYGSVEPDPEDRDKAWLRTDGGGNFLGWYVWTGAAWTILPSKAYVGTQATRDGLASPQDGWMFHVVGTGLSTYVESEAEWQWAFPAANEDLVGDKFYFFSSPQLLVSTNAAVGPWTQLDLSSYIATAGIEQGQIVSAIVRLDAQWGPSGFGGGTEYAVTVRAWGDDTVSTSAIDVGYLYVYGTRDDSQTSASGTTQAFVPMDDQSEIFYNVQIDAAPNVTARVWLVGFIYTPSLT